MRVLWADFEEIFDTHLEAIRAKRRAIVRREMASEPPPAIFVTSGRRYRLVGYAIVSPWSSSVNHKGVVRQRLFGTPVKPPRPKHRKGRRARYLD